MLICSASSHRCASSLDCTIPALPPAAVVVPARANDMAIEVEVTIERYAHGDLETLAESGVDEMGSKV